MHHHQQSAPTQKYIGPTQNTIGPHAKLYHKYNRQVFKTILIFSIFKTMFFFYQSGLIANQLSFILGDLDKLPQFLLNND